MPSIDTRRPAEVTAAFRERLVHELAPHGFAAVRGASVLVRREGRDTHRIELASSHRNVPGGVTCWVTLLFQSLDVRKVEPGWRAGGGLGLPSFPEAPPQNIADHAEADQLVQHVVRELGFFALLAEPARILAEVMRRYMPGMIEPRVVVPYLLAKLGKDAVSSYAAALLNGRPELWPAFVGAGQGSPKRKRGSFEPDHGTELAHALAKQGVNITDAPPRDAVTTIDLEAANLRCFFGRQLRSWDEPGAAGLLRRVPDAQIKRLRAEQMKLPMPIDDLAYVAIIMDAVGERRRPRRAAPVPQWFQYYVLQEPFGS